MNDQSIEFRAQKLKTRVLEIDAILAEWRRDFFVNGINRPKADRVALEHERAINCLERRLIGDAVQMAKVERRKLENASLLNQTIALCQEWIDCWDKQEFDPELVDRMRAAVAQSKKGSDQ